MYADCGSMDPDQSGNFILNKLNPIPAGVLENQDTLRGGN